MFRIFGSRGPLIAIAALTLVTLSIIVYQPYRESIWVSNYQLKVPPQPQTVEQSPNQPEREGSSVSLGKDTSVSSFRQKVPTLAQKYDQPEKEESLTYLSENEMLQGSKQFGAMDISRGKYSRVLIENSRYFLGEEIEVKIILFNRHREKIKRGGDYLRLWMENVRAKAAVSGKVKDNNDGTYSGKLRAMWSGKADIYVMILGRRQEITLMYEYYKDYHSLWPIYAEFIKGNVRERCICSVSPYDLTQKWCNLTDENGELPWFCIQPKNPDLSCHSWNSTWSAKIDFSLTAIKGLWSRRDELDFLQKRTLIIRGTSHVVPSPPTHCSNIAPEMTWTRKSPHGYFFNDQWHSTQCVDTFNHTPTAYRECLRGRTLYHHGDSTSKQFIKYLSDLLNFKGIKLGHDPIIKSDPEYNFTLSWRAHEMPFYHGQGLFGKSVNQAQHILLESIKNNSRDIIIVYLYAHFSITHPSVFKQHVQRLAKAVRDLISRAPGVIIALRGPHTYRTISSEPLLHSYWGQLYVDILYKAFAFLQKNVYFLDYWDLTMAKCSDGVHPPTKTVEEMVHFMMSIVCRQTLQ